MTKTSPIILGITAERISIAIIGLLAAIHGQVWWSIFMAVFLIGLLAGTSIRVKENK